jgi:hypothetical protein
MATKQKAVVSAAAGRWEQQLAARGRQAAVRLKQTSSCVMSLFLVSRHRPSQRVWAVTAVAGEQRPARLQVLLPLLLRQQTWGASAAVRMLRCCGACLVRRPVGL